MLLVIAMTLTVKLLGYVAHERRAAERRLPNPTTAKMSSPALTTCKIRWSTLCTLSDPA